MKYFRMSYEEVVFKRSYINIILLNRSIPSFDTDRDKDREEDDKPGGKKESAGKKREFANENDLFMSLM